MAAIGQFLSQFRILQQLVEGKLCDKLYSLSSSMSFWWLLKYLTVLEGCFLISQYNIRIWKPETFKVHAFREGKKANAAK